MRINGATIDGGAINGRRLYLVSSTLFGYASNTAGAVAAATAKAVYAGVSSATAGAAGTAVGVITRYGVAASTAGCLATAAAKGTYVATASGAAGAVGIGVPTTSQSITFGGGLNEATLNELALNDATAASMSFMSATGSAGAAASAAPTMQYRGVVSVTAGASASAAAIRTCHGVVAATAGAACTAVAVKIRWALVSATAGATGTPAAIKLFVRCAATAGAAGTVVGVRTQRGIVTATAGATASVGAKVVYLHASAASGTAVATILSLSQTHAAGGAATGGAAGVATAHKNWTATASASAGVIGTARWLAQQGAASGTAGAVGAAVLTLQRFARAAGVEATNVATATAVEREFGHASGSGTADGTPDWIYKASGTSVWVHGARLWHASGTCTAFVDPAQFKVICTLGSFSGGRSDGRANLTLIRMVYAAAGSAGCSAAVIGTKVLHGTVAASAGATATAFPNRITKTTAAATGLGGIVYVGVGAYAVRPGGAAPTAGAVSTVAAPLMTRAGHALGVAGMDSTAVGNIVSVRAWAYPFASASGVVSAEGTSVNFKHWGDSIGAATATVPPVNAWRRLLPTATGACLALATVDGKRVTYGAAHIDAGIVISVAATLAAQVPAPATRSMRVPADVRLMRVPYENRLMRVAA